MNCPTHSEPLTRIGNNSYHCRRCTAPWIIYPDPSSRFTFNPHALFAGLVLEVDKIFHSPTKCRALSPRNPQGEPVTMDR